MVDLFEALKRHQRDNPGSIALASRGSYMTYDDFVGNIRSAVFKMQKSGIKPGQFVVLTGSNPDAQVILALALLWLGCRVGFTADIRLYDSEIKVDAVIAGTKGSETEYRTLVLSEEWFTGAKGNTLKALEPVSEYSIVFASSGSTGKPKLIEYAPSAIQRRIAIRTSDENLDRVPRLLSAMGTRSAAHFFNVVSFLALGGTVIGLPSRDAPTVLATIAVFKPNYAIMSPSTLVDMVRHLSERPAVFDKVRLLRTSGSRCSAEIQKQALEKICERFISFYGATETGPIAWGYSEDVAGIDGCVGTVVDGTEVRAFSAEGHPLPSGSEGEIRVRNPDGTSGTYIGRQSNQPNAFKDGWFSTGDIGIVDENNNLIIRGRLTNVINVGGTKLNPETMEEHIRAFSHVRDVGVAGVPTPEGFDKICAAVVSSTKLTVGDINTHLARRRAPWKIDELKLVRTLPRTESGKIDRPALKRLCSQA